MGDDNWPNWQPCQSIAKYQGPQVPRGSGLTFLSFFFLFYFSVSGQSITIYNGSITHQFISRILSSQNLKIQKPNFREIKTRACLNSKLPCVPDFFCIFFYFFFYSSTHLPKKAYATDICFDALERGFVRIHVRDSIDFNLFNLSRQHLDLEKSKAEITLKSFALFQRNKRLNQY